MIIEIIFSLGVIGLGCYFGWLLANRKFNNYKKSKEKEVLEVISQEEWNKQKEDDKQFWKMKKEVENERRKKYRENRPNTNDRKSIESESGTDGRESTNEDDSISIKSGAIQDNSIESDRKNESESINDSQTNKSNSVESIQ